MAPAASGPISLFAIHLTPEEMVGALRRVAMVL